MSGSQLFLSGSHKAIERNVADFLNSQESYLSDATRESPRAVGDAIQAIIEDNFEDILGEWCHEYSSKFARRAMADLAFGDKQGNYYVVDVKTHRMDTKFNMPNLTSVERLTRFYEDETNYFTILNISYHIIGKDVVIENVNFVPIEYLDWECLTIGALGWGQIQIANSNRIIVTPQNRANWMVEFCEIMLEFYPKEIGKITNRIEHFREIYEKWKVRQASSLY